MEIKFNCVNSGCGQRISVDESVAGEEFSCPACGMSQQVPASKNVKFNCSNLECAQHIIVDVSETGRFVKCPACGKATQVPGPKPKSLISVPISEDKKISSASKNSQKKALPISLLMRLLYGWSFGAALFGLLIGGFYLRAWALMPKHLNTTLDEIFSNGRILDAPVVNNSGSMLLFAQEIPNGVGVFLENLTTLKRTQIQSMKTVEIEGKKSFRLFGWSPDDNYLAFSAVTVATNQNNKKYQEIVVCDGTTGAVKSSVDISSSTPRPELGVWLTMNSIAILNYSHKLMIFNLETDKNLGPFGKKGLVQSIRLENSGPYDLVRVSDRSVAYCDKGNIWTLDIPASHPIQLTHFSDTTLEWLDYSPKAGKYLFCLTRGNDVTNRYVYEFVPNAITDPVQLTDSYSFKGQWLQNDVGFACVCTEGDKSYLAIKSDDKTINTNVFAAGSIRSYAISPQRDTIYAVASLRYKGQSIWEYNIFNKSLRDVLPLAQPADSSSKIILPVSASAVNTNGETVEYYYVPPAKLVSKKKYPAVLDLYPVNRYDQNVQILANADVFYVSATRLGLNDWQLVAKPADILAVYNEMLKNRNIDSKRIYICGRSFSTGAVTEMANDYTILWRGIILFSPVVFPQIPVNIVKYPSLFIAIGDEDDVSLQNQCNLLWQNACARLIPARLHYEHTGHGFKTENYKTSYALLIEFIKTDY
jgi:predicted esterase